MPVDTRPYYTPEFLHGFEEKLRELTGGEIMFIELGISILVAIAILFRLVSHYLKNKKKQSEQPESPNKDELVKKNVGSIEGGTNTINIYNGVPEAEKSNVGTVSEPPKLQKIHSDRLPTVKGEFFGRVEELKILNDAWAGNDTRIIQFIAPGGTGKTKLLRHWVDHTDNIDVLIAWSFYSQGASEDKQVSATPFFSHAFKILGSTETKFDTDEDKGEYLADLLRQQRSVLVLDGLEPLQHASPGMRGELKDRAVRQLLKSLAGQNNGLCIITTRIAVHELSDRAHICSHDLQNLAPADGVKLLQSLDVKGRDKELEKAVKEYGCHALALSLLGNLLHKRFEGEIQKRDLLTALVKKDGDRTSRHAFKVMQAYQEWFASDSERAPELAVLHLLGLFDHPIEKDVLQVLWDAQIPNLTAGISADHWQDAITALRDEHHLLFKTHGMDDSNNAHQSTDDLLDCHPLIREYFGQQLREQQPDAWQKAHARLYDYYKALPEKEFPGTVAEMQPLFSAVAHGCAAGLHQKALDEVYYPRIQHKEDYLVHKLGAFSDDLSIVAHFFTAPWHTPAAGLVVESQAAVLNWAGYGLRALGRLHEALEPMQAGMEMSVKQKDWQGGAVDAGNLSELKLTLGDVAAAMASGQQGVDYSDQSSDNLQRVARRTDHADALHQAGETAQAFARFIEADQLQQEWQPEYPHLYSVRGFKYCDFLLAQGEVAAVLERAEYARALSEKYLEKGLGLHDIGLDKCTLGRAYYQQGDFSLAADRLDQAVAGLREAGQNQYLPLGLLARAALYRDTRNPNYDFPLTRQDLQEVHDIAEPSGMLLHMTDYHLEMARLLIAEQPPPLNRPLKKANPCFRCKNTSMQPPSSLRRPAISDDCLSWRRCKSRWRGRVDKRSAIHQSYQRHPLFVLSYENWWMTLCLSTLRIPTKPDHKQSVRHLVLPLTPYHLLRHCNRGDF